MDQNATKREVLLATLEDVPGILQVLKENLLSHKENTPKEELETNGFIVFGFTKEELETFVLDPNYVVLVLKEGINTIGYIMGYPYYYEHANYTYKEAPTLEIQNILNSQKILYYRHLAKKKDKQGVGSILLKTLEEQMKQQDYQYLLCHVALAPLQNKASIAFHHKMGYQQVAVNLYEDYVVGTFLKKL